MPGLKHCRQGKYREALGIQKTRGSTPGTKNSRHLLSSGGYHRVTLSRLARVPLYKIQGPDCDTHSHLVTLPLLGSFIIFFNEFFAITGLLLLHSCSRRISVLSGGSIHRVILCVARLRSGCWGYSPAARLAIATAPSRVTFG